MESLRTLKQDKAIGEDDIAPVFEMIPGKKVESDQFSQHLTRLFNTIIRYTSFPDEWKTDRRIPIFKA